MQESTPPEEAGTARSGETAAESGDSRTEPGFEAARLGDLEETRREALERRLQALRNRPRRHRGSPGLERARAALAGAGGAAAAGLRAAARAARAVAEALRDGLSRIGTALVDSWFMLPLLARQRIAAGLGLLAIIAFCFFVLLPIAPCWVPGGDRCPPSDDAIAQVPADAAGYLHVNLDPETDQYEAAAEVAGRVPSLTASASRLLSLAFDRELAYDLDVQPWSAGELALVLAGDGLELDRMLMVEVADPEGAIAFSRRVLGPGLKSSEVDGSTIEVDRKGLAATIGEGFLLLGSEDLVRAAAELSAAESLQVDPAADRALESLPDDPLLTGYLAPGLAAALSDDPDLRSFNTFVSADSSEGVGAAVSFGEDGAELAVRSVQDPELAERSPDFFSALPLFEPRLTESVAADALAYLGVGDPGASAETLVGQAAATAPDLFSGLKDFNRRLRDQGGVSVKRDLLPLLEGEAALTVEPQELPDESAPETPGVVAGPGVPYLALLASGIDTEAALRQLAELQVPIAEAIDTSAGQAPLFESRELAGVPAQSLRLSPVVELTYAGVGEELIVATSPAAVERTVGEGERLADSDLYEAVTDGLPDQVSLLVYLDFRDLLALGERLFLAEDPAYAAVAQDLRTLQAAALAVTRTRTELATDLRVTIPEPAEPADPVEPPEFEVPDPALDPGGE